MIRDSALKVRAWFFLAFHRSYPKVVSPNGSASPKRAVDKFEQQPQNPWVQPQGYNSAPAKLQFIESFLFLGSKFPLKFLFGVQVLRPMVRV